MKQIEAQAVISASDKTGNVFEAVAGKIDRIAGHARKVDGLGSSFASASREVDRTAREVERLLKRLKDVDNHSKTAHNVGKLAGAIGAAQTTRLVGQQTIKAGAEGAHERVRMEAAGTTEEEIKEAEAHAGRLSGIYTPLSQTTIMHLLRNARSIVGTYEEAAHILEPLLKLYVVAQGAHPEKTAELAEDFDKLVKGLEIKGVTQHMDQFQSYLQGMAKAVNVFGDTLRPTDFYEMFKYGRQATSNLSEKFMLMTAPTLAQELGGSSAGKAFSSFYQAVVGGRMKQAAIKELETYGLIDPSKIERTKTGATKGMRAGGVIGSELAAHDPYAWVQEVFLPALAKKGVTDPQRIQELIAVMFQQGTAAQFVSLMATQQSRIEKDWRLVEGAKGLEAAGTFMGKDPFTGWKSVNEQFANLLQAASSPLMQPAADGMNAVARALNNLTESARKKPGEGVQWLGLGIGAAGLAAYEALVGGGAFTGFLGKTSAANLAKAPLKYVPWLAGAYTMATTSDIIGKAPGGKTWEEVIRERGGKSEALSDDALSGPLKDTRIDLNVKIEAPDPWKVGVSNAVRYGDGNVRLNGTTGSTGKSMPEAGQAP